MNRFVSPTKRLHTPAVLASAAAVIAFGVAACGGDTANASAVSAAEVAAKYGYAASTSNYTPAYALVPQFGDPRDMYARMLLLKECIKDIEIYEVSPPPPDSSTTVFDPRSGDRRFTTVIAQTWGYQIPQEPDTVSATVIDTTLPAGEVQKKEAECGNQTNKLLGAAPVKYLNGVVDAGWAAAKASDAVGKAETDWRTCMMPAGVVDLPKTPMDMPTPSVATGTDSGSPKSASEQEKQVAVLDADCRESSGYNSVLKSARADGELTAIGKDVKGFEAARQAYEEYGKKIEEIIQAHS